MGILIIKYFFLFFNTQINTPKKTHDKENKTEKKKNKN